MGKKLSAAGGLAIEFAAGVLFARPILLRGSMRP